MALVDSTAAFLQRCEEIKARDVYDKLKANQIDTFASLAYSCGTPQDKPSTDDFKVFAEKVLGANYTVGAASQLRRLLFESTTFVIAQLKQDVTDDSDTPKRLPVAEKNARQALQIARLSGVLIEREMLPSHALIDLAASMMESQAVIWIGPSRCTSRESEIQLITKEQSKTLKIEDSTVRVVDDAKRLEADWPTPLKLQWCVQRRGLALDQASLVHWTTRERWVQTLLHAIARDPAPGWQNVSVSQMMQADREAFIIVAGELRSLRPTAKGGWPMDVMLQSLRADPRITTTLLSLPGSSRVPRLLIRMKRSFGNPDESAKTRNPRRTRVMGRATKPPSQILLASWQWPQFYRRWQAHLLGLQLKGRLRRQVSGVATSV